MIIRKDIFLGAFDFWGGADFTAQYLDTKDFIVIEQVLEDTYPEGLSEEEINDIFRFEDDFIAKILGYSDFDELVRERTGDEDEEDEEDEDEDEKGDF